MQPTLVNERDIEPTVINKTNQLLFSKMGDIQLLDKLKFLGGATSLDKFMKAHKVSETKGFDHTDKTQNLKNFPFDAFYSELRHCNLFEPKYTAYVNLLKSELTTEQTVVFTLKAIPY